MYIQLFINKIAHDVDKTFQVSSIEDFKMFWMFTQTFTGMLA